MTIFDFIIYNNVKSADAIILRKRKILGMVDHYAIFLGYDTSSGDPLFVANYHDGVKIIPKFEINQLLAMLEPTDIDRFSGNEQQRTGAINRAMSRVGERAYNYFSNNCEHFKNWVHYGNNYSEQVQVAADSCLALAVGTGIGAIAAKNPKVGAIATGLLLLGILLKENADQNNS